MRKFIVTLIALAIVLGAAPVFADATPDGTAIYKAKCAMCHGADGKGQTSIGKAQKLRDLGSADVQKQTDQQIGDIIVNGKGKMPAFKSKLTNDEVKALVGFIRTLKK
ncbi:MAG TPA: cytochrome c [Thermoanaerobaculia bacterium]|nr:cytochrome c [Thermoanaerobaculia bacterium]